MTIRHRPHTPRTIRVPASPRRAVIALGLLSVGLIAAFVIVPGLLTGLVASGDLGDRAHRASATSTAFIEYWSSGEQKLPEALQALVDDWQVYHLVKAIAALLLLLASLLLRARIYNWRTQLRAGGREKKRASRALGIGGACATMLAVLATVLVMANVQGTIAPFSSLMSMLPLHNPHGELAVTIDQVQHALSSYPGTDLHAPPALGFMISDFARYHAVIAVMAGLVAVAMAGLSVRATRRPSGVPLSDMLPRRKLRARGVPWALAAVVFLTVAVANTMTTADPAPALLGFFHGGI